MEEIKMIELTINTQLASYKRVIEDYSDLLDLDD